MPNHTPPRRRLGDDSAEAPANPAGIQVPAASFGNGALPDGPWTFPEGYDDVDGAEEHLDVRANRRVPEATVARLPVYLRCLVEVADAKVVTISSERLAEMAGVNAAKVRKDLSHLGSYGTRGVGYDVEYLLMQVSRVLGLTQDWPVVIVGIGNLGHALARYQGFAARGFRIAALVDADRSKVGESVGDLEVLHLDDLPEIAAGGKVAIGIIATPAAVAQDVADRLVAAGITSILNFAPTVIAVPPGVSIRKVDLSIELQILSFYQQRRGNGRPVDDVPVDDVPTAASPAQASEGLAL